jgi:hypothetical protein
MGRTRTAGAAALVTGGMFAAGEALTRFGPSYSDTACDSGASYLANSIDLLKYGFMGVTVLLLLSICGSQMPKAGRIVGRVAATGSIVAGVSNGIEHCAHLDILGIPYVLGLVIGLLSTIAFGIFVARSSAVTPWVGWVTSLGVLVFLLRAEEGGAFVAAIAWIVVGIHLISRP